MSRIILIALACLVLSSCGIFRKSKRSEKTLEKVESVKDVQVNTDLTVKETGRMEESTRIVSSSDGHTKVFPSKGAPVIIAPDGTITTEADSVVQNTKRQTDEARNIVGEVSRSLDQKKDSVAKESQKVENDRETKERESKPSFWGIWGMWIGIGMAITIVIISLLFYLRL